MTTVSSSPTLMRQLFGRLLIVGLLGAGLFFISAGTLNYWEAWVYLGVLFTPAFFILDYLAKKSPDLLMRRMRREEKEPIQKRIMALALSSFLLIFLLPGLDRRFGWSFVPMPLVLAGDALVLLGYAVFVLVLKENRFAGRTIEVEKNQTVISSGPYALIRHPMYTAGLVIYLFTPFALGSYWALLPALALPIIFIARIFNEEAVLLRDLPGYQAYIQRVKYRLVPGLW